MAESGGKLRVWSMCAAFLSKEKIFFVWVNAYVISNQQFTNRNMSDISVYFPDDFMVIIRDKLIYSYHFLWKRRFEFKWRLAPLCISYVLQHTYTSRSNFQKVHKMHEWAKSMCDILKILRFLTDAEAIEKLLIFALFCGLQF